MAKEIERKFLNTEASPYKTFNSVTLIKQGYIFVENGKHLRVRVYPTYGVLCLKYTTFDERDEFEYEIPLKDAEEIYAKCDWTVEKKRSSVDMGMYIFDFDEYPNGLKIVEVEFKNSDDAHHFDIPEWLGREVGGLYEFSNITLAKENLCF